MKAKSSVFASFAVGALIASPPYTLSGGKTNAQAAGPARQGGGVQGGQPQPGGPGQFPQGQFGGQRPFAGQGGPMVNSMTSAGEFLFVASGDTIYKIRIESMKIEGQTKLPAPKPPLGGGFGGGSGRPGESGLRGGGGQVPPTSDDAKVPTK